MNPHTSPLTVGSHPAVSRYEPVARLWEWLLLAWIAALPVMHPFNLRYLHKYTLPIADLFFVGAIAAFLAALICRTRQLRPCSWYPPLFAYACALIASTLASDNVRQSLPKLAGDLYLILAAVLVVNFVTDREALRRAILAWLTGTAVTILATAAGVILYFSGMTTLKQNPFLSPFGTLPPGHYPRIKALFLNANMMCSYAVIGAMLVIAARQAGWISRTTFGLLLSGAIFAAAFSISPDLGGLCLVLGIWQARLQVSRLRARCIAGAGVAIAVVVFIGAPISMTPLARTSLADAILHPEPSGRLLTWTGAWHTFLKHPWLGQGLESDAADVHYVTAGGARQKLTDAHNTWLSIMAQQGLVGLCAFSWVVVHLVRRFRLFGQPRDGTAALRVSFELALIGGFLYQTLTGSFENTRHVWALMGIVAGVQANPQAAVLEIE